uniref:RNase H type-1 domain-containing protein n=1 Tax=Opuntia streptacantha TaxID=393608 RepID=A0A7C9CC66_OPUST
MASGSKGFRADWAVTTTEAYAVLHGLRVVRDAGLHEPELETDSLNVAWALQGRTKFFSYASSSVQESLSLITSFLHVSFSYVSRDANNEAHGLAKLAMTLLGRIKSRWKRFQSTSFLWWILKPELG